MSEVKLPEPVGTVTTGYVQHEGQLMEQVADAYTADQMRAAVLAERERLTGMLPNLIQLAGRVENAGYVRGLKREAPSDHEPEIKALVAFVAAAIRGGT